MRPTAGPDERQGLVVMISGRGSNLLALAEACRSGRIPARIDAVICDRPGAAGLERAAELGLDRVLIDRQRHASRADFEDSLGAALDGLAPRYIILAGFMRVLSADFVDARPGRMINIHPSLLPRHRGLETHRRALEAGDREHGASVHFVTPALDGGPVISQARLDIRPGDTPDTLADRLLPLEHQLLVRTTALLMTRTVELRDGCIHVDNQALEHPLDLDLDLAESGQRRAGAV
ncbi:phosphoribosylglycinamide formyltransferase [Wenzhouxiangella marina]|uniref:Phosphoribosylglycinamide formyltransferase n=1 Tax=Wenzhouxiangella marina TaxID=1579979 RepID=A0A0K0XYQ9_9GAMM|nr:phosphoribosylglycinamide formyltransferase [Wenzhouxiangella marina]AKS42829.1 hypothetical protein WM2015_2468 [Wenzhouxiangella marina]MBB6087492.1 phosphoribosylglycinamide formyltransferase-1 [Wenzhouxiangella marina]